MTTTGGDGTPGHGPRLRVPVTVRVSPDAADDLPAEAVRAAVADAVAAACARFPLAALGIRAADVTTVAVDARPSGTGPEAPRQVLDAAARGAADGAARAGFRSHVPPAAPGRVGGPPSEPFDPSRVRHRPAGTTYEIPFFDGGTVEVPLRDADGPRREPWLPGPNVAVSVEEAVAIAWRWHLYRHGGRGALDRELPGYYGYIRTTSGAFVRYLVLTRVKRIGPDGAPMPGRYTYQMFLDEGGDNGVVMTTGGSEYWLPDSGTAGPASRSRGNDTVSIVFAMQPQLPRAQGGRRRALGYIPLPGETGTPTHEELNRLPLDDEPSALDVAEPPRSGTGRQRAWPGPSRSGAAAPVCEPYLDEPPVTALTDSRNLTGRIRSLAAALSIPECGYAGTFALHCAQAVIARALDLAESTISSQATTDVTVHTDGTGNNGFVHVKPSPTPEMQWLRRLAGIAREVGFFAADTVSTYGDRANAPLFGSRPGDPLNAASWSKRFMNDLSPTLGLGYRTVFVETCRAIMLQQLRSSLVGITERMKPVHLNLLVDQIGGNLAKLGDDILWPTVLLTAIEHAARVHMSHGTVRAILSTSITITTEYGSFPLPPPIDSTPRRVLAIVGEDRLERRGGELVAVHGDKAWTADLLRQEINRRRQLLNMTDPLFFQIPDLQGIILGIEHDPGFLKRYLENLLTEMSAANQRMTTSASVPRTGAYFSLEASNYVKREGGRDWRGLRYTLQGIHQLADDHLAPEVRGDCRYIDAVNQAIGRREAQDTFVAIGSSVGIIVLGLFCAPLGAVAAGLITGVASLAFTLHDVYDAERQSDLYLAVEEDPELFQHYQDVQVAKLMAAVSVAFSVFDVVGVGKAAHTVASGVPGALRTVEKQGVRAFFGVAAEGVREQLLKGLAEDALRQAVRQAVQEATVVLVMNELMPYVITPVLESWIRRQAQEHGLADEVSEVLDQPATLGDTP
ncbi:hypothetical protein ACFY2T_40920 [Streptomyces sp. NPDC001260]|uniref:hypothetical protein n=1 Tax=Streptomyces sp. NPDC001260 TaxID=3364551 RepID=UPI0036C6EE70